MLRIVLAALALAVPVETWAGDNPGARLGSTMQLLMNVYIAGTYCPGLQMTRQVMALENAVESADQRFVALIRPMTQELTLGIIRTQGKMAFCKAAFGLYGPNGTDQPGLLMFAE